MQETVARKSHSQSKFSGRMAPARFRVVAERSDGSRALVSLASTRVAAVWMASRIRDTVSARRPEKDIVAICVEHWLGTATNGHWAYLGPGEGGFYHGFRYCQSGNGVARRRRKRRPDPRRDLSLPRSGDHAECTLLAKKTRKGGWMAKLVKRDLAGPLTNWAEIPESAKPGQSVTLRIGAIDDEGTRIQFDWLAEPNKQHRSDAPEQRKEPGSN